MPRRHVVQTREIFPDAKYGDLELAKFINILMENGKKSLAERIVYGALEIIQKNASQEPLVVFQAAIEQVGPTVEVKPRRIGGATYQIPVPVRPSRKLGLARRWLVAAARKRKEQSMAARLANELLEAANGNGSAVRKREDMHRMAEANKAYSHFRY